MRDPQELADSIIHLYLSLVRYQRSRSQAAKKQTGQSGRRMAILRCLLQSSPRSVGEIGRYLYVSDATVSRILDDMETRGYVSRRRCSKDSRRVLVEPTEAGRDLVAIAPKGVVSTMRETLPELDVGELERMEWSLKRLTELVQVDVLVVEE
ncbi:MAG: MarR family transcriptional regulator [Chloroflexi bacterium]|nr:MarR family transcriptional regulator [Chloroflexota bacterium]